MALENQNVDIWTQLSQSFSETIASLKDSIVTVHSGGRSTSSGVVWRPGIVVTTHHGLRRREGIKVFQSGEPFDAELLGGDAGTDLAVLRIAEQKLKPIDSISDPKLHAGEVVLSVGRSRLGDISASSGIIARTGSAWRSWRGGQIEQLIRPDVRLYVGQSGSVLVNQQRKVLGINSPALAHAAIVTVPTQTVNRIVDAILERGHVPRPFLGIAMQAVPVPQAVRAHFSAEVEQALLVMHVEPNAPAAKAGVMVGDLIVSANGEPVHSVREILHRISGSRVGDSIALVVIRAGAKLDLTVGIADRG